MSQSDDRDNDQAADAILFVTGDSPRSVRARSNLATALGRMGGADITVCRIDLLEQPDRISEYGIFATPALVRRQGGGKPATLYGDLSNEGELRRFLADLDGHAID